MKAHFLLRSKDRWTQEYLAVDKNGIPCLPNDITAAKWDTLGALVRCYAKKGDIHEPEFMKARQAIKAKLGVVSLASWADDPERKWEEVYQLLVELDL